MPHNLFDTLQEFKLRRRRKSGQFYSLPALEQGGPSGRSRGCR